jgi:hypothetical protein
LASDPKKNNSGRGRKPEGTRMVEQKGEANKKVDHREYFFVTFKSIHQSIMPESIEIKMEDYQRSLFPYNIVGSVEDAKDAVQEAVVKLMSVEKME